MTLGLNLRASGAHDPKFTISMNIQEQYFKGVPDYYPSMYLDGYTPQQIMYAVRNKMIQEYKKRKMAKTEPEITEFKITSEVKVK